MPLDSGADLLDVVDADDRVVGQATRADVHRRQLLHRAVHILVTNAQGALYVQQRALTKDCQPGLWDTSAAGHVDSGESYAAAAVRELSEELGIVDAAPCFLHALPASRETGFEFVHAYHCATACEPRPDPVEIARGGWWSLSALAAWIAADPAAFTAVFRELLRLFAARQRA
jgi:isopentenyl-diphosphate Delta-isomerase